MRTLKILMLLATLTCSSSFAQAYYSPDKPVHVDRYTKQDGTVVHDYYRSEPNR